MKNIVYLFKARKNLYKIGYTNGDPERRLGEVQTGCPHPLEIYAYIDLGWVDAHMVEQAIHRELQMHRTSGEWFALTKERVEELIRCYGKSPKAQEWGVKVAFGRASFKYQSEGGDFNGHP